MSADAPAYEREPYETELTTRVVAAGDDGERPFVVLEDTILYPEGGGQPCDHGSIEGVEVVAVRRVDGEIRHDLASPVEGAPVKVVLDWERRYDHMQQHTAQHLLSAVALQRFGWPTTSFHLGENRCDIELDTPSIDVSALTALEDEVMQHVRAARLVTARRISADEYRAMSVRSRGLPAGHQGSVRLVEISGADSTTCGGTHVRSTAEIESIQLGPTEPMRGGTRLFWIAGGRVRRRIRQLEEQTAEMRRLFETSEDELIATVDSRLSALKKATRELRRLGGELAEARAATLAANSETCLEAHFDGFDGGFLASLARHLVALAPGKAALLTASDDAGSFFVIAAGSESGVAVADIGPKVAATLGGRGGGKKDTFQGKAESLARRADAVAQLRSLID